MKIRIYRNSILIHFSYHYIYYYYNSIQRRYRSKINYNTKGKHRRCHTAKCNMLNKWLKRKKFNTGHSYFHFHYHTPQTWHFHAHMHKYKPHTYNNICTYATHHQKVTKSSLPPGEYRVFLVAMFSFSSGWDRRVLPPGEYHVIHTPMP